MFNLTDFTSILNETQELIEKAKISVGEDAEEIQFKIDSNLQALQIMGSKIEDPVAREKASALIQSLCTNVTFDTEETITRIRSKKASERSDLVDKELLKNSVELKKMAIKFNQSLKADKTILQSVSEKMHKSTQESSFNTKILELQQRGVKSSTYITFSIIIFLMMYFFIRFC